MSPPMLFLSASYIADCSSSSLGGLKRPSTEAEQPPAAMSAAARTADKTFLFFFKLFLRIFGFVGDEICAFALCEAAYGNQPAQ